MTKPAIVITTGLVANPNSASGFSGVPAAMTTARALQKFLGVDSSDIPSRPWLSQAEAVLAAVTPLIRAAALEDVVQVIVHSQHIGINATVELVRSVRALKKQP